LRPSTPAPIAGMKKNHGTTTLAAPKISPLTSDGSTPNPSRISGT
jgi:hypothetical protein